VIDPVVATLEQVAGPEEKADAAAMPVLNQAEADIADVHEVLGVCGLSLLQRNGVVNQGFASLTD
jgi:hypothetical protein